MFSYLSSTRSLKMKDLPCGLESLTLLSTQLVSDELMSISRLCVKKLNSGESLWVLLLTDTLFPQKANLVKFISRERLLESREIRLILRLVYEKCSVQEFGRMIFIKIGKWMISVLFKTFWNTRLHIFCTITKKIRISWLELTLHLKLVQLSYNRDQGLTWKVPSKLIITWLCSALHGINAKHFIK